MMFEKKSQVLFEVPIPQQTRKETDSIWTILTSIFALAMFIGAFSCWDVGQYKRIIALKDSRGRVCEGYLSFPNYTDPSIKQCVESCPAEFEAVYGYDGNSCQPKNEALKEIIQENPEFNAKYDQFMKEYNHGALPITIGVSCLVGFIWFLSALFFPRRAPILAFSLAIVALVASGALLLISKHRPGASSPFLTKQLPAFLCLIVAAIMGIVLWLFANELRFQGIMLQSASRFLRQNPRIFWNIPIFSATQFLMQGVIIVQQACFAILYSQPILFSSGGFLGVINIIEFFVALQFLRDSFTFFISCYAIQWYHEQEVLFWTPYKRIFGKHWGTIAAGSFFNAFFYIPALFYSMVFSLEKDNLFARFFSLPRTDIYSYLNLTGLPYWNCVQDCKTYEQNTGIHSFKIGAGLSRHKLAASVFTVAIGFLVSYFVLRFFIWHFDALQLAIVVVYVYSFTIWFVEIQASAAEGLQMSFLIEFQNSKGYNEMRFLDEVIREELIELDGEHTADKVRR